MTNNSSSDKKKAKDTSKKKKLVNYIFYGIWGAFFAVVIAVVGLFALISYGVIGYVPPVESFENPIDKFASQVISADGQILGTYSVAKNNRIYSRYSELSPYLVEALVATEDERFYEHSGVDYYSLGRAIIKTGILGESGSGGGSTISQQLAKILYTDRAESKFERLQQKIIEWVIAARLEKYYSKDEIINMYFNQFDFLYNAVGIQSASKIYFNKIPVELSIEEAATLVGMCKNPALYNPIRRPKQTQDRRNVVLKQMVRSGYLSEQEYDSIKVIPLETDFQRMDHNVGLAPHFREYLRKIMTAKEPVRSNYLDLEQFRSDSANWASNPLFGWINKPGNTKPNGTKYSINSDGLKIYTTIDSRMQAYAEESIRDHFSKNVQPKFSKEKQGRAYAPYAYSARNKVDRLLERAMKNTDRYRELKKAGESDANIYKIFNTPIEMQVFSWAGPLDTIMTPMDSIRYHKHFLRTGFVAMENKTGHVKAYVGDIDYTYFKYDMVNQGRRQVGSTFKPFLYALSMQEGITPCDEMLHVEQVLTAENGRPWIPRNAGAKRVGEMVTIKWGLQNSSNWVTAYLMSKTSPYSLMHLLRTFGVMGNIDPVVSMCLGTDGITVGEMAGAYTAFANHGVRSNPIYVTRIEDQHGNILATFQPRQQEVFSETAYVRMLDMLRSVVDGGTGSRLRRIYGLKGPLGGKTGTTQENADAWFMGFSPALSTATWVGGEERDIHFDRMIDGQGAALALPICGEFLSKVYADPTLPYSPEDAFEPAQNGEKPCPDKKKEEHDEEQTTSGIEAVFN